MENVIISEVLLTDEHTKIKYACDERRQGITKTNYGTVKSDFQPAGSFRDAIKVLRNHLAVLLNYSNEEKIQDIRLVTENTAIVPTGIKYFKKPESDSVQIVGFIHSKGKQVAFTTPKIDLMDSQYKFLTDLEDCVHEILAEAEEYIEGKFDMATTQLSLMDQVEPTAETKPTVSKTEKVGKKTSIHAAA